MRISDWSSDVCSSDLPLPLASRTAPRWPAAVVAQFHGAGRQRGPDGRSHQSRFLRWRPPGAAAGYHPPAPAEVRLEGGLLRTGGYTELRRETAQNKTRRIV